MAHEITVKDVFGEVRARGERAWHGLGVEMPPGLGAWEGFQRIGLDWETELLQMQAVLPGGGVIMTDDVKMHVRKDTRDPLGTVSSGYRPISNRRLAEWMDELCGADAAVAIETAGSLRGGRRVFCSVKLPKTIEVVNEDILELYIIGSNAHDGSARFNTYGSSIRPVCANTLGFSERDLHRGVSFQHTGDVDIKIEKARAALGIVLKEADRYETECQSLVRLNLNKEQISAYFEAVYDKTFGVIHDSLPKEEQERRAEHKKKTLAQWMLLMDDAKQNIKGITGTAWAAFNAYSQWSDHERGRFGGVDESDDRVHSNLFGVSAIGKKKAWKQALSLIGAKTLVTA